MLGKLSKLGGRGELAEPEEVSALLEGGSLCEFVDVDAAIGENAGVAVDPADGGRGGDDAFQALWCDSGRHKVLLQERIRCAFKLSTSGYSAAEKRLSRTIGRISVPLCD